MFDGLRQWCKDTFTRKYECEALRTRVQSLEDQIDRLAMSVDLLSRHSVFDKKKVLKRKKEKA
jgi:hypothetical protein